MARWDESVQHFGFAGVRMDRPARLYLCAHCRQQVILCSRCDRGNLYCGRVCRQQARKQARRESAQRYQRSWRGRICLQRFYLDARTDSFLSGHALAFAAFGGVPRVLLYDNLKSAVLERVGQAIRLNPQLLALAGHACPPQGVFHINASAPAQDRRRGILNPCQDRSMRELDACRSSGHHRRKRGQLALREHWLLRIDAPVVGIQRSFRVVIERRRR